MARISYLRVQRWSASRPVFLHGTTGPEIHYRRDESPLQLLGRVYIYEHLARVSAMFVAELSASHFTISSGPMMIEPRRFHRRQVAWSQATIFTPSIDS